MKLTHRFCAWICAALLLIPLAACSQGSKKDVQAGTSSGEGNTGTRIVGEVTSVAGNQVTLAVGKLNRSGNSASGSGESAASASSKESLESASSGLITLTGETKTVLIPVGLSLSTSGTGGLDPRSSGSGTGSGTGSGQGGAAMGGGQGGPPSGGGNGSASGGSNQKSGSAAGTARTTQKSRDFSSITTGMILQITEQTLSDGTQGIVKVSVLSE